MTENEKKEAILAAYEALSQKEKYLLDRLAAKLSDYLKGQVPNLQVGHQTALEIIGSIGILLAREGEVR
jgi:hypothetical protein